MEDALQILPDGRVRIGNLDTGQYEEFSVNLNHTITKVTSSINSWLTGLKYTDWTVTVTSIIPFKVQITTSQRKTV